MPSIAALRALALWLCLIPGGLWGTAAEGGGGGGRSYSVRLVHNEKALARLGNVESNAINVHGKGSAEVKTTHRSTLNLLEEKQQMLAEDFSKMKDHLGLLEAKMDGQIGHRRQTDTISSDLRWAVGSLRKSVLNLEGDMAEFKNQKNSALLSEELATRELRARMDSLEVQLEFLAEGNKRHAESIDKIWNFVKSIERSSKVSVKDYSSVSSSSLDSTAFSPMAMIPTPAAATTTTSDPFGRYHHGRHHHQHYHHLRHNLSQLVHTGKSPHSTPTSTPRKGRQHSFSTRPAAPSGSLSTVPSPPDGSFATLAATANPPSRDVSMGELLDRFLELERRVFATSGSGVRTPAGLSGSAGQGNDLTAGEPVLVGKLNEIQAKITDLEETLETETTTFFDAMDDLLPTDSSGRKPEVDVQ